jgi:hypothetical protein
LSQKVETKPSGSQEAQAEISKEEGSSRSSSAPPEHFLCPITRNPMIDPVTAFDGRWALDLCVANSLFA